MGFGFLEQVYENALVGELSKSKFNIQQQIPIQVFYQGELVGEYFADVLIDNKVIVEIKSENNLVSQHEAQLLNFGPQAKFM